MTNLNRKDKQFKKIIETCPYCDEEANYHTCGDCGSGYYKKGFCDGKFCSECEAKNLMGEIYG